MGNKEMKSYKEVSQAELVDELTLYLKANKVVTCPPGTVFVKTGPAKENSPDEAEWFFVRAASTLRRLADNREMGVMGLAKLFGSRNRRRIRKAHKVKSACGHIRQILQQLEKAGYVEMTEANKRRVSVKGHELLGSVARTCKPTLELPVLERLR